MSVEVYIWYGDLRNSTVLNGLFRKNVGHASMMIIEDSDPSKRIYISHRPKLPHEYQSLTSKDDSKKYYKEDFCDKALPISLADECKIRGKEYDEKIELFGLNEINIRKCHEKYLKGLLPESRGQYHILENNCCSTIAYFLREGLNCSKKLCVKCIPSSNLPDKQEIKSRTRTKILLALTQIGLLFLILLPFQLMLPESFGSTIVEVYVIRAAIELHIRLKFNIEYWAAKDSSIFLSKTIRSKLNMEPYGGNYSSNFWSPITLSYFTKNLSKKEKIKCLAFNKDLGFANVTNNNNKLKAKS
jgi:hypothetical protein